MALVVLYLWNTHKVLDKIRDYLKPGAYRDYDYEADLFGIDEREIEDGLYFHSVLVWLFLLFVAGVGDSVLMAMGRLLFGV